MSESTKDAASGVHAGCPGVKRLRRRSGMWRGTLTEQRGDVV